MAIENGPLPTANGEFGTCCRTPVPEPIVKPKTNPNVELATYRYFPNGETVSATGLAPVGIAKGDPATSVRAPVPALIEYTEILLELTFAANRNAPPESIARADGLIPAGVRGIISDISPVLLSILNNEMSLPVWFAAYANLSVGSSTREVGEFPPAKGDPTTGVKLPEWLLTRNAAMEFELGNAT